MQEAKEATEKQDKGSSQNSAPKSRLKKLYIGLGGTFAAVIIIYVLIGLYYRNVFFPATIINGIDVSGLTPSQAQEVLNADIALYTLALSEDDGNTEQITGSDIGLYARDDNMLQTILSGQNILTWGFQGFLEKEYTLDIDYDEENLRAAVDALSCMDKKKWISPENAYISYDENTGYEIVPAVWGNTILTEEFYAAVSNAVNTLESSLSLRDNGLYRLPEISDDDASLQEEFTRRQTYYDMSVTYQFDSQTEVLDGATITQWISFDKNGKIEIDEEAAAQFVKELAKKYNTAYSPKTLETSYGETVTIKNGFYGWQIDQKTETENLLSVIRDGKTVTKEPAYLLSAASHDGADYGNTYVEINLTAQHLFYYKDGELLIESDFVSGNPSKGNATPAGAYAITYTERNATLKGQDYRTPVSYWMPFNGNIGMHDSSWRSSFGGAIYQTNGSHGCINLPPSVAKVIFENIEKGIPVLCYHLGGTQQNPNSLSEEQIAAENNPAESEEPGVEEQPAQPEEPDAETAPAELPPPAEEGQNPVEEQPVPEENTVVPEDSQIPPAEQ